MTIETKIAKNGSLTVKVDFKRAKRNDAERVIRNTSLYGGKVEIIAEPNDPYGVCDIYTGGFDATENCYVFVDGAGNTYHFAYVDDILYDMAHGTLAKRIRKQTSATDIDAEEYAVSTEAFDIAIDAEIELATATDTTDEINIDDATYRTILLHAEKISNGQNSFAAVLKNELRNLLNVDASELIEAIKTDSNFLNRVRCYLADFPIIITNDEGTRYHLVKLTDDYCELDIINDEPATEQEKSTMTTTERFWTKSYNRYGASRITAFATLDEAIASAKAEVAEDHDHWVDIIRETNTIPKVIETIEWKPELDELNDVDEPEIVITQVQIGDDIITYEDGKCASVQSLKYGGLIEFENGETRWFTNPKRDNGGFYFDDLDQWDEGDFILEMIVRGACYHWDEEERFRPFLEAMVHAPEPPVDDFDTKLAELQTKRDAAQEALLKAQEEHEAAENTLQKFLSDTAGNLATKLQSLKLDYSIKLVTKNGYSWTVTDFSNIYVDAFDGGKIFAFTDWRRRRYASYDTPAQVDKVIDMLRAAIESGETKFTFPAVDELITTRKAA